MDLDKKDPGSSAKKSGGFLQSILDALFNSHSPEAEKRRKLKAIAKDLSRTKYHSFYKVQTGEMMPTFPKLFYDVYKLIFSAQNFLRGIPNKNAVKSKIINYFLSENQLNLLDHLNEQKIQEMSRKLPLSKIKAQIE